MNSQVHRRGVVILSIAVLGMLAVRSPMAGQQRRPDAQAAGQQRPSGMRAADEERTPEIKTPPEITIQPTPPGPVFADAKGFTVYVSERDKDPGKSFCYGPCTIEWIPVRASADAKPFGDWTLIPRDDGAPQWAYKGRPLYGYAREARRRWAEGQGDQWRYALVSPFPERGAFGRGRGAFGQLANQRPKIPLPADAPGGITGQPSALGPVFADGKGFTLYTSSTSALCAGPCLETWKPLTAPQLATAPKGDWTIVNRPDGTLQWAYKGKPLYRSEKDIKAGDTKGERDDWHAVRVPGVAASAPKTAVAEYGR